VIGRRPNNGFEQFVAPSNLTNKHQFFVSITDTGRDAMIAREILSEE
jgi:hypothetical protein